MKIYYSSLFSIIFLFGFDKTCAQNVYVNTTRGQIFGYHVDYGSNTSALYYGQADVFVGIPYVKPPVGSLRFQVPQRLSSFPANPYNATGYGAECVQPYTSGGSEDCLYLNIYTPNAQSTSKYPVMLYIHGGGLLLGDNRIPIEGTVRNLVSRGVVVVSIQYRLGLFGFFTTFTDDFPPNLGMLDQVEAMKFVQEEISNFGGDPTQVTLFGQSAGSASISAHTYSPLSQDLFHQGIQESGTVLTCYEGSLGLTNQNFQFAQRICKYTVPMWNSGNYNQLKDCLYNISVEDALKYDYSYVARSNITNFTREFVEGYLAERFINFFGNATQDSIELFENIYLEPGTADDDHLAWYKLIIDLGTTFFFTGGAAEDVELHIWNNNSNIFLYEFTYSKENFGNTGYYPVIHGAELTYLFMIWDQHNINETDVQLANFFGESWTNFAKNGKPTTDDSWKPVTTTDLLDMEYLDINPNRGMKAGYRVLDRIQFTRTMPILVGPLPPAIPDYNNGSRIGCPEGWTVSATNSKKCFNIYHFSPLSQTDAQKNCEQYFGSLLSIDNAFENAAITGYIQSNAPTCTKSYIGLMEHGTTWKWMNGDNSTYLNWEPGNPSTDSSATCAVINSNDGKWSNQACTIPQCYICSFDF